MLAGLFRRNSNTNTPQGFEGPKDFDRLCKDIALNRNMTVDQARTWVAGLENTQPTFLAQRRHDGLTALHLAIMYQPSNQALLEALVKKTPRDILAAKTPGDKTLYSNLLHFALNNYNYKASTAPLSALLTGLPANIRADLLAVEIAPETPTLLHFAVEHKQAKIIKVLFDKIPLEQLRIDEQNNDGNTALHEAARLGDREPLRAMLGGIPSAKRPRLLQARGRNQQTVLDCAANNISTPKVLADVLDAVPLTEQLPLSEHLSINNVSCWDNRHKSIFFNHVIEHRDTLLVDPTIKSICLRFKTEFTDCLLQHPKRSALLEKALDTSSNLNAILGTHRGIKRGISCVSSTRSLERIQSEKAVLDALTKAGVPSDNIPKSLDIANAKNWSEKHRKEIFDFVIDNRTKVLKSDSSDSTLFDICVTFKTEFTDHLLKYNGDLLAECVNPESDLYQVLRVQRGAKRFAGCFFEGKTDSLTRIRDEIQRQQAEPRPSHRLA